MKIAVAASNGKVSRAVISELIARGHEVTAFARSENKSAAKNFVQKDIMDLTKDDLAGFDAVVDGFGAYTPETLPALRSRTDAKWVFVSPAADFRADGAKTGRYILGGEELTLSAAGESIISYADYALGMADLIESGAHIGERVSLVQA